MSTTARPGGSESAATTVRRVADVAARYAYDVVRRPKATDTERVPARPRDVTPAWLTQALCRGTRARVSASRYEHFSDGTASRGRLHVTYEGPSDEIAGLPTAVFAKSTPGLLTRLQVGVTGGAEAEIRFYDRIGRDLPVRTPAFYYGKSDRRSGRSIMLLEDLTGVEFGDPTRVSIDRRRAEQIVDVLAAVHGAMVDSPRFDADLKWVRTSLQVQQSLNQRVDFARRIQVGIDRATELVPSVILAARDQLHPQWMRAIALDAEHPLEMLHTDVHAGNWFLTPTGVGLFDWTAVARGRGTRDLAYALSSNLATPDRRAWERELVERYAQRLGEVTGAARDAAEIWTSYRQQMLHGLCYWLYTIGRGRLQPKMQSDAVSRVNIERMAQAAADLETLDALACRR